MAIDKINLVQSSIKCLKTNLSFLDTSGLEDIIRGQVLSDIINKECFEGEDLDFLDYLIKNGNITCVESDEFFNLMFKMTSTARERSHGAAPLFKAYINDWLYDSIAKHTGAKEISVYKVRLVPYKWLYAFNFNILGVCKNKYGSSRYQDLLIAGKLRS